MRSRRIAAFAAVFCAVGATEVRAQPVCLRAPARTGAPPGRAIVITEAEQPPCTAGFVRSATALDGESSTAIADFARFAARAPDGRVITYHNARVHVWGADGKFQRVVGRLGSGPGEFAAGAMTVDFSPDGRILVGDNNRRWSVFSRDLTFIGSAPYGESGGSGGLRGLILGDGSLVSVNGRASATSGAFTVFDLQLPSSSEPTVPPPRPIAAFEASPLSQRDARLAASNGNRFWAVRLADDGGRYVAELWDTDGTKFVGIERRGPWLAHQAGGAQPRPAPEVELVHDDGTGLLVVIVMAPNARWRFPSTPPRDGADFARLRDEMVDIHMDVIDVRSGMLLAHTGPLRPSGAERQLPNGFFRLSRSAYRREESARGTVLMQLMEFQLRGR